MQFYKIISTGETYSLDKTTGKATKVDIVPPGARVLTWAGAGLPPDLQGAQMPNPTVGAMDGQGGPGVVTSGGKAYPMGDYSLVKFQDANGKISDWVWQLDNKAKTMRPFVSQQAFESAYAGNLDEANKAIVVFNAADRGPGGSIEEYELLEPNYAIQGDGSAKRLDASNAEISRSYGKPAVSTDIQDKMVNFVGGYLNMLQKTESGIDSGFVENLKNDPKAVAFYINAATYGGYTPADIYRDLKKKELVSNGDRSQENIQAISPTIVRSEYAKTDAGRNAYANQTISPPQQLNGVDPNIMNYAIFDLPDEAFKTLVPPLKKGSVEMQAYMDKVNTAAHDILIKQIEAKTESEKAVADYEWKQFKTEIERTLGIKLSNNSLEAWKQLENARETFSQRGISGSGMEAESIDDYLRNVRRGDQLDRETTLTSEEKTKADYYKKFATAAEIAALSPEDKMKYGLAPSDEIKNALSFETLKQKYPAMSDNEINALRSSILDENNNYRSNLYQKKVTDIQETEAGKKTLQELGAEDLAKNAAEKAAEEFTSKAGTDAEFASDPYSTTSGEKNASTAVVKTEDSNNAEVIDPSFKFSIVTGKPNPNYKEPPIEKTQNTPLPNVITPQTAYVPPKTNAQGVSSAIKSVIGKQQGPTPIPPSLKKSFETLGTLKTNTQKSTTPTTPWSSATATDLMSAQPQIPKQTTPAPKSDLTPSYVQPTLKEKVKSTTKDLINKVKFW